MIVCGQGPGEVENPSYQKINNRDELPIIESGLSKIMLFNKDGNLIKVSEILFDKGFDRVFSLYPKNEQGPDILEKKHYFEYLSTKHPDFYIDDLTFKILNEGKYKDWSKPCHYGRDIISINEKGQVSGCSFSNDYKLTLEKPSDILKINDVCFEDRFTCPYLRR